jgi:hypothetical protein
MTGTVDQELLVRNEYLVMENCLLRNQITGRVRLSDGERKTLAALGQKLGRQALKDVATIVKPDTILAWHRHPASRKVQVAGVSPHPDARWMVQIARNVTMADWGFLAPGQYLIHDRDGKYGPAFQHVMDAAGVKRAPLPPQSPNLNAYAEGWVRSIKEKCLSRLILCGEASLHHALTQYVTHVHHERHHQGKGNGLLFPVVSHDTPRTGPIQCRERLGGLLKYYERAPLSGVTRDT